MSRNGGSAAAAMAQPGARSLRKIAVLGRGTAGSLAASSVTRVLRDTDHELHHIYDSRIPVIGVGEGSWPGLVVQLQQLTKLPLEALQMRLKATRKYGVAFDGWGRRNRGFIHHFLPRRRSYAYHLSADSLVDLLRDDAHARHIDAKVLDVTRTAGGARVEFENLPPEHYDLVFDARGFPAGLDPGRHIEVPFIPTNTAVIRRCPAIVEAPPDGPVLQYTYTRSVARPHGWIFVIPLAAHTSCGYIFNRDISSPAEVESDFDAFLHAEGVSEFEQRAVIPFPNFVHRDMYDGAVARIGNAGAFMEPLEATAIAAVQIQIGLVLHARRSRAVEKLDEDAPVINGFLVRNMLYFGLFVGWHYACGSKYESEFWRHARDHAWPLHRKTIAPVAGGSAALRTFDDIIDATTRPAIDAADWKRTCGFPFSSYYQVSRGLGCRPADMDNLTDGVTSAWR